MINLKTASEIEQFKAAGQLSAKVLMMIGRLVRPGVTTLELDQFAERIIRMNGGIPAFKGYMGFPGSICSSVNDELVHGIPGGRILQDGDVVSIDTGAIVDGWVGDNAFTFPVGNVSSEDQALLDVTRDCLYASIEQAVPGNHLGDIGHACQELAERHGYGVVREYVGHGIGHDMHEAPNVPNFGKKGSGVKLKAGMVLAIEPMITLGSPEVFTGPDGWLVSTKDGKSCAHFEKTVAITKDGPLILTEWDTPEVFALYQ